MDKSHTRLELYKGPHNKIGGQHVSRPFFQLRETTQQQQQQQVRRSIKIMRCQRVGLPESMRIISDLIFFSLPQTIHAALCMYYVTINTRLVEKSTCILSTPTLLSPGKNSSTRVKVRTHLK